MTYTLKFAKTPFSRLIILLLTFMLIIGDPFMLPKLGQAEASTVIFDDFSTDTTHLWTERLDMNNAYTKGYSGDAMLIDSSSTSPAHHYTIYTRDNVSLHSGFSVEADFAVSTDSPNVKKGLMINFKDNGWASMGTGYLLEITRGYYPKTSLYRYKKGKRKLLQRYHGTPFPANLKAKLVRTGDDRLETYIDGALIFDHTLTPEEIADVDNEGGTEVGIYVSKKHSAATVTIDNVLIEDLTVNLATPTLSDPAIAGVGDVQIDWSDESASGAASYELEVSDTIDFSNILQNFSPTTNSQVVNFTSEGTYYLRVRSVASDGVTKSDWSETVDLIVEEFATIATLPPVTGTIAGFIDGSLNVAETGAAIYAIDLAVAPGTSGMAPKLALQYNSQNGNNILGTGWSLSGLSAISRCGTTIAQDGFIDTVDFDNNDKFCLDGQRLVAVSGVYGADGTEYRTENETFSQIFSYGTAGNGPEQFIVKTKNGLKYEYGVTTDSRVEAQGRADVLVWKANRVEDVTGNYFSVTYSENTSIGESYPTQIDYTGNDNEALSPYNAIQFIYESRNDDEPKFISGSQTQLTKRLKTIQMLVDGSLAWEYRLTYQENNAKRSQLTSITECDDQSICLDPTTFTWQTEQIAFENPELWLTANSSYPNETRPYHKSNSGSGDYGILIDMNGDGLIDRLQGVFNNTTNLYVAYNNGNGLDTPVIWESMPTSENQHLPTSSDSHGHKHMMLDMNADGLPDRVSWKNYETNVYGLWVYPNNGSGFDAAELWMADNEPAYHNDFNRPYHKSDSGTGDFRVLLDMNGDALPDRVMSGYNGNNTLYVALNTGTNFASPTIWDATNVGTSTRPMASNADGHFHNLMDMNGDSLPDRVSYKNYETNQSTGLYVKLNNGSGFDAAVKWLDTAGAHGNYKRPLWTNSSYPYHHGHLRDMNGDGLPDHVTSMSRNSTKGLHVALNTGAGFLSETLWWFNSGYPTSQGRMPEYGDSAGIKYGSMDMNGDGLPDRIHFHNYGPPENFGTWVATNNGKGFEPVEEWIDQLSNTAYNQPTWQDAHGYLHTMIDIDGDGILDRVSHRDPNNPSQYGLWVMRGKSEPNLITKITNGLGAESTISYTPLTDASIYTRDYDAVYPAQDLQGPIYVVSSIDSDDGIGGTNRTSYNYEGLKRTLNGRGFCGFRQMETTDEVTGIKTTNFFRQDHPYKTMPYKKEVRLSDDTLISRTEDTWSVTNFPNGNYFPHVTQSIDERYEIDGIHINTTTTTRTFDNFGNATQITVAQSDGHTETTVNTFTNDTTNWILGRLTRSEVTKQAPGQSPATRAAEFVYDSLTGMLIEEITEPDDPNLWMSKSYLYDDFGNIIESTIDGPDINPRTQYSVYDNRGQFIIESSNTLGHTEFRTYDLRHGKMTSLTGPNNLTTNWQYDNFGRQTLETRADGTETRTVYFKAEPGAPSNAIYYTRTDTSGSVPGITYYDLLNRKIRKETVGFDGSKIFVDTEYNAKGEVSQESDPYFEGDAPLWTVNQYDVVSRLTQSTAPGNRVFQTIYSGLTTSVLNPLSQTETRTTDSLGQLVESKDNLDNAITYTYDSFGNLILMQDSELNTTTMQYDIRGNKTSINDPDSGITDYTYNSVGELTSKTNARNFTTSYVYDDLGRLISRTDIEGTSSWVYDTATNGIGKLTGSSVNNAHARYFAYDALGRQYASLTIIGIDQYYIVKSFDEYSRLSTTMYPTGFAVTNEYNTNGFLNRVKNAVDNTVYQETESVNARGQVTEKTFANGLTTTTTYDPNTSYTTTILTTDSINPAVQNLTFQYDAIGNLTQRRDESLSLEENFTYDNLNRLTNATVVGGDVLDMTYDDLGNITSMSGVGNYIYGQNGAGPHAVTTITGPMANTYFYDATGNRNSHNNGGIAYTSYNKPYYILNGLEALYFDHDANRNRHTQIFLNDGVAEKVKYYIGGIFEREISGLTTTPVAKDIHFIRGAGSTFAIHIKETGQTDKMRYLHKDHLGSIQAITDESASPVEFLSFDAWGNRRNAADWSRVSAPTTSTETDRGFTGHEQLDDAKLIHMNGRVYDPTIGRFLSPDPHIQAPESTQNLNRYSYVLNNPLSYTDPSGFFFKAIGRFIKKFKAVIIAVAVIALTQGWASGFAFNVIGTTAAQASAAQVLAANVISGAISAAIGGATSTFVNGGSPSDALKAGLRGAAISIASFGAGQAIGASEFTAAESVLFNHATSAVVHIASGGKLDHSFFSSTIGSQIATFGTLKLLGQAATAPQQNAADDSSVKSSTSGTASEIGGGKSINGAGSQAQQETVKGKVPIPRHKPRLALSSPEPIAAPLNNEIVQNEVAGLKQRVLISDYVVDSANTARQFMSGKPRKLLDTFLSSELGKMTGAANFASDLHSFHQDRSFRNLINLGFSGAGLIAKGSYGAIAFGAEGYYIGAQDMYLRYIKGMSSAERQAVIFGN